MCAGGWEMAESRKQFFTTGEAAEILGLSPSTVIRRFDKGELWGRRHPLTGKRLLARTSLERFLEKHGLCVEALSANTYRVLIADGVRQDVEQLKAALEQDPRIAVETVCEGCEVCGRVMEWTPHLVIVNASMPDMRGRDVIRTLRVLPLAEPVRVGLSCPEGDQISPVEMAALGVELWLPKPWRPVEIALRIRRLLGLAGEGPVRSGHEHRKWSRVPTSWFADLEVYLKGQPHVLDTGRARVRNISEGGALLHDLEMRQGALPAKPFAMGLRVVEGSAQGLRAKGSPVRIETDAGLGLGLQFDRLDSLDLQRLREAISSWRTASSS